MSRATAAALLPAPEPEAPKTRPGRRLTAVTMPARRRRPKLAYAIVALAGAALIGIAQIGLSLAITNDSFVLADLTAQQNELDLQTQALKDDLAGSSSPQLLATKAAELGMVVAGSASYLRLSDGAVTGAGSGADWQSTVDPTGAGAVHNALLDDLVAAQQEESDGGDGGETAAAEDPDLPPTLTDGLPSPTTR